jgi:N-methylhydantoinase A
MSKPREMTSTIAIDTGGTFTDIILAHDGKAYALKVPSTPDDPAAAALRGTREILARHGLPHCSLLIHGSTVATNALLERKGARVALITNRGCEDVIEIGRQNRPQLYALVGARPPLLVAREMRIGVSGRLDYRGQELTAVDVNELDGCDALDHADAVGICTLHSYANPAHEIAIERALIEKNVTYITRSSALLPEYREYERTATCVVNAYVMPLMDQYLARLSDGAGAPVRIMGSNGGALPVGRARREPVHTVLSGPAGGVMGALASARSCGIDDIIAFDMGGTSTDVSLCPGEALHTREFSIAGTPVAVPLLDIHTVGAGGGSIAWVDAGGALRVGPRSAGARPGPICYGRGGTEVTVTDANVWLGRLPADRFLGGEHALDRGAIEPHLSQLAEHLGSSLDAAAEGVLTVVNATMEGAMRVISVERGFDPRAFTLVAFGGAAGLHVAELADGLGISRVLLPVQPGLLSAYGMLVSPVRKSAAQTVLLRSTDGAREELETRFRALEEAACAELRGEGIAPQEISTERWIDARYAGQSHELRVRADNWIANLHAAHDRRYGYANRDAVAEAVTLRVEASGPEPAAPVFETGSLAATSRIISLFHGGAWHDAMMVDRAGITSSMRGPVVVTEYSATTFVPGGWRIEPADGAALIMEREER